MHYSICLFLHLILHFCTFIYFNKHRQINGFKIGLGGLLYSRILLALLWTLSLITETIGCKRQVQFGPANKLRFIS